MCIAASGEVNISMSRLPFMDLGYFSFFVSQCVCKVILESVLPSLPAIIGEKEGGDLTRLGPKDFSASL